MCFGCNGSTVDNRYNSEGMKEYAVGERFQFEGITVEVVEETTCNNCVAHGGCLNYDLPVCTKHFRKDGKSVIFKKVETGKELEVKE
jgi:positive regulator of sigma E activity